VAGLGQSTSTSAEPSAVNQEEARAAQLEKIRRVMGHLAARDANVDDGQGVVLENQAGQAVQLSTTDRTAIVTGLALHDMGKAAMEKVGAEPVSQCDTTSAGQSLPTLAVNSLMLAIHIPAERLGGCTCQAELGRGELCGGHSLSPGAGGQWWVRSMRVGLCVHNSGRSSETSSML
jgi:hypothetical protein